MGTSNLYYVDPSKTYESSKPSPRQNLIDLYNLTQLALSVARTNPDGSKGIKLRKSYKSHISDLPGKHTNIKAERDISPVVFRPNFDQNAIDSANTEIKPLDMSFLTDKLRFDRTPDTGIPDFDVSDLAVSDASTLKNKTNGSPSGDADGESGKKRKKKSNNDEENLKRRKLANVS